MRYSVLLPYYDPKYEKTEKFSRLVRSIVRNASTDDYELIIVKDGPSYAESHNRCFENAHGEVFIVFNDDIEVLDPGFMEKFTVDGVGLWQGSCHAWSMRREDYLKVGGMDERFSAGFNCEDTDWLHRAKLARVPIVDVDVSLRHDQNRIAYGDTGANRKLFLDKWGFEP